MTIPANQLSIINAGQAQVANAKTALQALVAYGDDMMALGYATSSPALIGYTQKHRAAFRRILADLESAHAALAFDLVAQYGLTDGGAVVMGGGAR